MRIAVTGTRGQLVRALAERAPDAAIDLKPVGRPELDMSRPATIRPALTALCPDLVVNAAAYTAVDQAESEPDLAARINAEAAGEVAAAARIIGVPVIQISTDYVFDGAAGRPSREDDPVVPLGLYGATKLAGERAVASAQPDHVILRTAWIFSPLGHNFVRTMLRLGRSRDEVAVVADQRGCPTDALALADIILAVAGRLVRDREDANLRGVFHAAGAGETSWAGFAQAIFAEAAARGRRPVRVRPIPGSAFATAARRPADSRLDCARLAERYGLLLPPWQDRLPACIARLLETEENA